MPSRRISWTFFAAALLVVAAVLGVMINQHRTRAEQRERAEALTGGSAQRGAVLYAAKGCGGCHTLKGASTALVGPPLDGVAERAVIAGVLENSPDNLAHWIRDPQGVVPGNAMPNLPMSDQDAKDISAYLYSAK